MTPYYDFLYQTDLSDIYMDQYDPDLGPVAMTHKASTGTSESRLDKWFSSSTLTDYTWVTNTPPLPFQSDHYPIAITLHKTHLSDIQIGKMWRLSTSLFKQQIHLDKIK